ncbi:phytanoyl-CoA dioxygenase family protein [Streptomyces arenae]|nr:phytanoyl-CoA dioxygenase family protein [Streptomyces arenae]
MGLDHGRGRAGQDRVGAGGAPRRLGHASAGTQGVRQSPPASRWADGEESFTTGLVRPPAGMASVQTVMRADDALFFHGSLVHGSLPNTSRDRFRRSLILHYVPRASVEVAQWYLPLVAPDGADVHIAEARGGGPCGDGWAGEAE